MAGPAAVPGVDPSRVNTPDELAACLDGLPRRRGLSYEVMADLAAKLPSRSGRSRPEPLPKSTVGEIVTGKRLPTKGKLLTFLAVCEVAPADLAQWLAAWERASTAGLARPAGGYGSGTPGRACWACTTPSRSTGKYLVSCLSTFRAILTTGCVPN
jgi:hypothetical protein